MRSNRKTTDRSDLSNHIKGDYPKVLALVMPIKAGWDIRFCVVIYVPVAEQHGVEPCLGGFGVLPVPTHLPHMSKTTITS